MGYATTTTGHVTDVQKTVDRKTIKSDIVNGQITHVVQTCTTTVEHWRGLSSSDADTVCTSSVSSTLNGTTRAYLGGVTVTVASSGSRTWFTILGCWGTEVSSVKTRDGDSSLFNVARTTREMDIEVPGVSSSNVTKV